LPRSAYWKIPQRKYKAILTGFLWGGKSWKGSMLPDRLSVGRGGAGGDAKAQRWEKGTIRNSGKDLSVVRS